jgi:serine/threonine-protein kinase
MDDAQRFKLLSELFDRARDLPRPELERFLAGINDAALREELSSMVALDREGTVGVEPLIDIAAVLEEEPSSVELELPEQIGNYDVIGVIGSGASSVVLKARQPETDRVVALKVLGSGAWDARALARFRREVRLLGRLDHPNIARVYEAGQDSRTVPARPYFVLEYVDGVMLVEWARAQRGRGVGVEVSARGEASSSHAASGDAATGDFISAVIDVFEQIALAVGYAHAHGVVHRDLKPANILVRSDGRAKVLDFGVSGVLPDHVASAVDDTRFETPTQSLPNGLATNHLVGTVPYMSPEQFEGTRSVEQRSDLYSIGVMLYECLAGALPYTIDRGSIPASADTIRRVVPAPLGRVDPAFAGGVESVVAKLLEKEPADRYQSANELIEDLRRLRDGRSTNARPITPFMRARRFMRRGATRAMTRTMTRTMTRRGTIWGHIHETPWSVLLLLIALGASMLGFGYATYRWREAERRVEQLEREVRSAEEITEQRIAEPPARDGT